MSTPIGTPTNETTADGIREIRSALADAAEAIASDLRTPLPTEHGEACQSFCPGPSTHLLGAVARTMLDISRMHEALAKATRSCSGAIGATQLQAMRAKGSSGE